MRLRLSELQENNEETKRLRDSADLLEDWKDVKGVFQYQELLNVLEIIHSKGINCHHNDSLIEHFSIDKTRELVSRKYYWPSLKKNIEAYVRGCDVCLVLKTVRYKLYRDLQSLPIPMHQWKNLSIDFMTGLSLSID